MRISYIVYFWINTVKEVIYDYIHTFFIFYQHLKYFFVIVEGTKLKKIMYDFFSKSRLHIINEMKKNLSMIFYYIEEC